MLASTAILSRFCRARDGIVRLALEPAYLELLAKLGDPHKKLPPVLHVAGTNGKGSTCAFLRAMLEAAGYRVHVYTSPHLVRFHERIRIAGQLISEDELAELLGECERLADHGQVSDFEAATAAAFMAFARHPADAAILEVGMGGRLDATNVIETSAASIISRLSYDHCKYLGPTLTEIAREKAGIMRKGVPCFAAPQPQEESLMALRNAAADSGTKLSVGGIDWKIEPRGKGFHFTEAKRALDVPPPALIGPHQLWNAGLAIASLSALPFPVPEGAIARGIQHAEWPARLQKITQGNLAALLPPGWELWLDGGHNDSAGQALALQMENWRQENADIPLSLILGMLTTKNVREFLEPLTPYVSAARVVDIPNEALAFPAQQLLEQTRQSGMKTAAVAKEIETAISELVRQSRSGRLLICGSLYLAGHVLRLNETSRQ